jgi:hypothetical protein
LDNLNQQQPEKVSYPRRRWFVYLWL